MRRLSKLAEPELLKEKKEEWKQKVAEVGNDYYKTKYREPAIKKVLINETSNKCIYCESKIGHNTPGDVEHKIPVSIKEDVRFEWGNLTISCTECNRRKNDYYDKDKPFIDPYVHDVENILMHWGPLVLHKPGEEIAEISLKVLELNDIEKRKELIARKVEKLKSALNLMDKITKIENKHLRKMLILELHEMGNVASEYSAMVKTAISQSQGPWMESTVVSTT
jgi:hypothetical protein